MRRFSCPCACHGRSSNRRAEAEVHGCTAALRTLSTEVIHALADRTCHDCSIWSAWVRAPTEALTRSVGTVTLPFPFKECLRFSGLKVVARLAPSFAAFALDNTTDLTSRLLGEPSPFVFGLVHLPEDCLLGRAAIKMGNIRKVHRSLAVVG